MTQADFSFGAFTVQTASRTLREGGEAVGVSARGFDLLVALLAAGGRTVSKEELLRQVWQDRSIGENNLTVAISALRKVLREAPNQQTTIRTVFGQGYRFVAPLAGAEPQAGKLPGPDRPSIAVLPFRIVGHEPDDAFLGDGIAEDIITELSRNRWLTVISRSSTASLGHQAEVGLVLRDLAVRYVLFGSLRKSGHRVRVSVQLVDESGNVCLAERYDREIADIFAVQDEIAALIVSAIRPALSEAEESRAVRRHPESMDAWSAYQRGVWHFKGEGAAESAEARLWFERAIAVDPHYAPGHYGLATLLVHDGSSNLAHADPDWRARSQSLAERSVALDDRDSFSHSVHGLTLRVRGDNPGALRASARALALNPNDASAHGIAGATLVFDGRPLEGIEALGISIRLSPRDPRLHIRHAHLGIGHLLARQHAEAAEVAQAIMRRWPDHSLGPRLLATVLAESGDIAGARQWFQRAFAMSPASFDDYTHARMPWFREEDFNRVHDALVLAGMRPQRAGA